MVVAQRRLVFAIVSSIVVATTMLAVSAQSVRTLRFVSPERPPFTDAVGKPRFALDLVEAALKRVNVTATTTIVPPDQYAKALLSGPFDGTALGWRDQERERAFMFSDPYLENRLILVGRSGSNVSATSLAALKGKKIAVVTGYAYGDGFDSSGPVWVRSRGEQDSLSLLLNGSIDYFLMDELVVQYLVQSYPEESRTRLAIGTIPLHTRPVYLSLSRSLPDAAAIIGRFNSQLKIMIADRTYHQLLHVDWIRADVDGDGQVEYVAASNQAGRTEPRRAYDLFSATAAAAATAPKLTTERYFFDGAVYNGWSSVPDKYKVDYLDRPDHTHPTARIMTFTWK
jgi:polar amino acid transport system substrate-binding protein